MINSIAIMPNRLISNDNQQQNIENNNSYIEIDADIINFEQLIQHPSFKLIRNQYKESIQELAELYYVFTGIECKASVKISIENIYSTEKNLYPDLFYSYRQTRKQVVTIIKYLVSCKENQVTNNQIPIICGKLADCFGFCLSGFNSKITDINDYMLIDNIGIDFKKTIDIKIKKILQETIREVLLEQQNKNNNNNIISSNVHCQNAFFNLIADELNLESIVDKYANIDNISHKIVTKIINKVKISFSHFNLCKYIANYFYKIFEDCLYTMGKTQWLNNSIIQDFLAEDIEHIENAFIHPFNKYLCLGAEKDTLKSADIFIETEEIGGFYLDDIKDKLHYFLARNINIITKVSPSINSYNKLLINIGNNINIYNIYNCYFYVLSNKERTALKLNHLLNLNIDDITINMYIPMFRQALENTTADEIAILFNNKATDKIISNTKYSKYIMAEINKIIETDNNHKQKLINAITNQYIKNKTTDVLLYKFITSNILVNEIIEKLLKSCVDMSELLKRLNTKEIRALIFRLDSKNLLEILYNYSHISKIRDEIFSDIYEAVYAGRNCQLLKSLNAEFKNKFLMYLSSMCRYRLLLYILDENKYDIAKLFIQELIKSDIRDKNNNYILHHIVINKDEASLKEIIATLDQDKMHKLQFIKNRLCKTPLMLAIEQNNNHNIINMLLESKNTTGLQNNCGDTALMVCVTNNKLEYLELILQYCDEYIINKININRFNALMLASTKGYLNCLKVLLRTANDILLSGKDINYNNSLMLALINKHDSCGVLLIEKYNADILLQKNKNGYNSLMLAAKHNNVESLKKILAKCDDDMIMQASNASYNNSLMLSIINKNHQCTKELLKISTTNYLNKKNHKGENALNLAINYNSNCLEEIIALSTTNQIQNITNNNDNALSQVFYHGLNNNIINALIEKSDRQIFTNKQTSSVFLLNAIKQGHLDCLKILSKYLTAGDFLNIKDAQNNNCLMIAIKHNYYNCAEYLINTYRNSFIELLQTQKVQNLIQNNKMRQILKIS